MARPAPPAVTALLADETVRLRVAHARQECKARGAQLTETRALVLEMLLRRGAAKAYDLLAQMQAATPGVAPMTIYRALDFLVEQGLVHKVESTSSFIACQHEHHPHQEPVLMVCQRCGSTTECEDQAVSEVLDRALGASGFHAHAIEIKGVCGRCAEHGEQASPARR